MSVVSKIGGGRVGGFVCYRRLRPVNVTTEVKYI